MAKNLDSLTAIEDFFHVTIYFAKVQSAFVQISGNLMDHQGT
uniref:Uncharacterized protein n=1 Tax=Arundo donax TaxID=35708 RepID=A0A0A8Y7T8_ARUDO